MLHDSKSAPLKIPNVAKIIDGLIIIQQRQCHKCSKYLHTIYPPHHAFIHNNSNNRKKWSLLVHHPVNLVLLCYDCHQLYPCYMQIQSDIIISIIIELIIQYKNNYIEQLKQIIYYQYRDYINWCNTEKKAPKRIRE